MNARNTMLKNTFSCLQRCRWQYWFIVAPLIRAMQRVINFIYVCMYVCIWIRLAVVACEICEILWKFELIQFKFSTFKDPRHQQHPWFSGYQQQQMFSGTSIEERAIHSFFVRTIIDWNHLEDDIVWVLRSCCVPKSRNHGKFRQNWTL